MINVRVLLNYMSEGHCLDFLREEAEDALGEILSRCPEAEGLLSDGAREAVRKQYADRMVMPCFQTLALKIQKAAAEYDVLEGIALKGDNPEAVRKAAADVGRSLGAEGGKLLRREAPMIQESAEAMRKNFIRSTVEMLRNILACSAEIGETLLEGRIPKRILGLSGDSGDMHRHGRVVRRVETDSGIFYYKPHDCLTDRFYGELVNAWFSDCTLAPKMVLGDGCGFAQEIRRSPLSPEQTPGDYFRNFGMLTALFHGIGARDMHAENIRACGAYPAAVDLETILTPRPGKMGQRQAREEFHLTAVDQDMNNTVLNTGVLPIWVYKVCLHSALHNMEPDGGALPFRDGQFFTVSGFEREFLEGFRTGYDRVLAHREEIRLLAKRYADIPVRYISNNTSYYFVLRQELFSKSSMAGPKERQRTLDKLEGRFTLRGLEPPEAVIRHEQKCLLEGDIPYYCVRADGRALCGEVPEEVLIEDYFDASAMEMLLDRLNRLSGDEMRLEEGWIRAVLRHVPLSEKKELSGEKGRRPLPAAEARKLLEEIAGHLFDDRVEAGKGLFIWYSVNRNVEHEQSCGAVSLMADAASFCSFLPGLLPSLRPRAEEIISSFLQQMEEFLEVSRRNSPDLLRRSLPLDGRTGLGALVRTLQTLSPGRRAAEDLLRGLLRMIAENGLFHDCRGKGAEAGLLLALCAMTPREGENGRAWKECIRGCARSLLQSPPRERIGDDAESALALYRAGEILGEEKYLQSAREGWTRVQNAAVEGCGWHDTYAQTSWLSPLGQNTALIGLWALEAGDAAEGAAETALGILRGRKELLKNDSLTEGNAAWALFLMRAARKGGRPELLDEAGKILAGMAARRGGDGLFACVPEGIRNSFDVNLFRGETGVGCVLAEYLKETEDMI